MATILVAIGILGAAVVLLALRILVRGGEFRGTCASNNPYLRDKVGDCIACGQPDDAECEYRDRSLPGASALVDRIFRRSSGV
jgi:hypothetical protein